ncbi:MAG: hypothetical protein R3281_17895 [Balneolaceae bacterium]|nr:hypothetical protein [Balneolaceae bacterium]
MTTILAAGATSLFLVEGSDEERVHSFIWPAVGGVTALLVKTEEERRYESYAKAREDIAGRSYRSEVYFGLSPLPGAGLLGTVLVRF